jgi:hypothetical protein
MTVPHFEYTLAPQPHRRRRSVGFISFFANTDRSLALVAMLLPVRAVLPQETRKGEGHYCRRIGAGIAAFCEMPEGFTEGKSDTC